MNIKYDPPFLEPELLNQVTTNYENFRNNIKQILDVYGFVIINNILNVDEICDGCDLLFVDLINCVDIEKINSMEDDEKHGLLNTLKIVKKKHIFPQKSLPGLTGKGFLSTHGLPQGEFAWKMRTNQKCREIYEFLHNTNDLVISTDLPFYTIIPNEKTNELWPHADQVTGSNLGCENSYQGILYLTECTTKKSANTVVLPKSNNNEYNILLTSCEPTNFGKDFNQALYIDKIINPTLKEQMMNNFIENSRRVQINAGSLLIFSSKTLHQGFPGGLRIAQTICYEPREYRDQSAYKRKLEAVHKGIGTTHWASLGLHHGASNLRAKNPSFSNDFHSCVFPMKKIKPYPISHTYDNISKKSTQELEENILSDILQLL